MSEPTSLEKVIGILEKQGYDADQVAAMCDNLSKNAFGMLYTKAIKNFTEDDFEMIEACRTTAEKNRTMRELYNKRMESDLYEDLNEIIEKFSSEFLNLQSNR